MIANACVTNNTIHIRYTLLEGLGYKYCFSDKIGKNLIDFSSIYLGNLNDAYNKLLYYFIENMDSIKGNKDILLEYINLHKNELELENAYASYFNSLFISFLYKSINLISRKAVYDQIKTYLSPQNKTILLFWECIDPSENDEYYRNLYFIRNIEDTEAFIAFVEEYGIFSDHLFFYILKEAFMCEIKMFHSRVNNELIEIFESKEETEHLSAMQKLFYLDMKRKNAKKECFYTTIKFPVCIKPVTFDEYDRFRVFISDTEYRYDDISKILLAETSEIKNISELFSYEMIKIATTEPPIKKCEYCNRFFILDGRKASAKYCDRIALNEKQPCNVIGATKKYTRSEKHPSHYAYDKIYKHYHYLWTQKKEISMSDFDKWKIYAVGLRDKCKNGDIPLQELQKFYDLPFADALNVIDKY